MNRSDDYIMGGASGSPNDHWKCAFDDASEAPPPRIWDAVERQLDLDDEDGIIPLWQHRQGQQSMLFGRWAAGIAASLLLTLFGWWAWHRDAGLRPSTTGSSQVAIAPKSAPSADKATPFSDESAPKTNPLASASTRPERLAANVPVRASRVAKERPTTAPIDQPDASEPALVAAAEAPISEPTQVATEAAMAIHEQVVITQQVTSQGPLGVSAGQVTMSITTSRSMPTMSFSQPQLGAGNVQQGDIQSIANRAIIPQNNVPGSVPPTINDLAPAAASSDRLAMNMAPLSIQPLSVRAVGNDRIVWYRNDASAQATPKQADVATNPSRSDRRQRAWVSAGMVASTFNPTLATRSTAVALPASYNNVANTMSAGSAAISAQTGSAVAVQVSAGVPLGEHWAIETGVGYLSSQAGVQSPGRMTYFDASGKALSGTMSNQTLYTDLISNRLSNQSVAYNTPQSMGIGMVNDYANLQQNTRYEPSAVSTVSNAYQFVQVPAQVSYEFRPRRKFGLSLLTGLVSNWFVRNTVNQNLEVKASDGIYRPVTMAGTAGVRVRYRPDSRWSASMAGMYQQHLQSLTVNDVNLQALPQQVGLSFSVDRHF